MRYNTAIVHTFYVHFGQETSLTTTQFLTRFTGVYLLLNLLIAYLLGVPLTAWLALVFICMVFLAIFLLRDRKRSVQSDELKQLTWMLRLEQRAWKRLEKQWLGRTVRLKEDIRNPREPEGLQLYVQAGTPGTIVALNRDEDAPFTIKFPGFGHNVKVRLDKLDVPLDKDRAGNVPAKPRAFGRHARPLLALRAYDEEDDDDDVPEDAEAFVDALRHFAALDWHVWSDPYARRAYQQMRHYEN